MKTKHIAIIGSGIAGLSIAEILTRNPSVRVCLIESESKLASGVTREFHEWYHMGGLYTMLKNNITSKYVLGALDDMFTFYSNFENMNLTKTRSGLSISGEGWFQNNHIHFYYKNRPFNFIWNFVVSRSICALDNLSNYDWLRKNLGERKIFDVSLFSILKRMWYNLINETDEYIKKQTPDLTMNSRKILNDMLESCIMRGNFTISLSSKVHSVDYENNIIYFNNGQVMDAETIILANGAGIKDLYKNVKISTSYAPIAVVSGLSASVKSFTALDYYTKNCINILTKEDGYGLAGGISLPTEDEAKKYIDVVLLKLRRMFKFKIEHIYISKKNEITFPGENRNYVYHIVPIKKGRSYACVPGKFSLAFSLGVEMYREIFNENPPVVRFKTIKSNQNIYWKLSKHIWQDIKEEKEIGTN